MTRPPLVPLGALLLAAAPGARAGQDAPPPNDASLCPYCHGDPERMAAAGVVSHGGFEFGTGDTASTDALLEDWTVLWIETAHFELGMALEPYRIDGDEKDKLADELARLHEALPDVPLKTRTLDPWLRLHLYAQRLDDLWERMQGILQVSDADFPAAGTQWILGEPYHGEGPHLGMGGKFELLVVPSRAAQRRWLMAEFGLDTERTQRWNVGDRQTLIVVINAGEHDLQEDVALHGHVVFSTTINLLDGYEFYAYETPVWLREGLAHYLERELDPRTNSFSYSEASLAEETRRTNWTAVVRRMKDDAPSVAELAHLRTTAEMTLRHHYAAWSMTAFLVEEHPDGYACLTERLHGIRDAEGKADGSRMTDRQREAFEACLGLRYPDFDRAWRAWAEAQDPRERKGRGTLRQDDARSESQLR